MAGMRARLIASLCLAGAALAGCGGAAAPSGHGPAPSPRFSPYQDATIAAAASLPPLPSPSSLTMAFAVAPRSTCAVTVPPRPRGAGAVRLSFGGRRGPEPAQACVSVDALAGAYRRAAASVGASGLDFDVEGAALGSAAVTARRWGAVVVLQRARTPAATDVSVTLPVDPTGLTAKGLAEVRAARAAGVRLARVNLLAMDYGDGAAPRPAGRMATLAEASVRASARQLAPILGVPAPAVLTRVGVTLMIGVNDVADEVVTPEDARAVTRFAHRVHLGGLSEWELSRDRPCPAGTPAAPARPDCSGLAAPAGAFTRALAG